MSFANDTKLQEYLSPVFFETGTFLGEGTKKALSSGFEKVITIELQEYLYNQCVNGDLSGENKDLVEEIKSGRVDIHLGDSKDLMWRLIENIDERITFWLDAHIDGGNYIQEVTPDIPMCPLYEELRIIKKHKRNDHIILIDDIRIMGNFEKSGHGWGTYVSLDMIKDLIIDINPNYVFKFEDGVEPDDILVAYLP